MNTKHEFAHAIKHGLKPLHALNNWRGPLAVIEDYAVIAAAVALARWQSWLLPLSVLLIGSRQRALASLLHESCHMTLARHRRLNDVLGRWLAGFAIFQSHASYRRSHVVNHHRFLGDPQRDPDYINCLATGLYTLRDSKAFMRRFVLRTVMLGNVPGYLAYLFKHRLGSIAADRRERLQLALTQAVLLAAFTAAAGWSGYLLFWLLPYLTSFQVIGWLSEICEHYRLYERRHAPLEMTRNRFPSWWERLFVGMHGDNYHQTHHLFAGIPFWNLARAHRILLADPRYAELNAQRGGIVSAPPGRMPVLREIALDIDRRAVPAPQAMPVRPTLTVGDALIHEMDT